jgi:uncharacterized protein (TIGR03000 family)
MKRRLLSLLVGGVLAIVASSFALAEPLPVKTVEFDSASVGRKLKYNIVLPDKYDQTKERYPVLYLLHGFTGNYTNWSRMGVPEYARSHELIVVMPDGGNSWYVNWAQSDEGQKNQWEDGIVKDLISHVDTHFRTIARREGRAINGLSMGGYGALMLGLRHPDLFCSIGSHSGAVAYAKQVGERLKSGTPTKKFGKTLSTTPDPKIAIDGFSSQAQRMLKGQMFTSPEQCAAYDPFELVLKLPREKLPYIYFDCGTEDQLYKDNVALAKILVENKIPHTFAQSAGAHNGAYWAREVGQSMAAQYALLQRELGISQPATASKQYKPLVLKVLVPEEDATISIDQKTIDGAGTERRIKVAAPPKGKDFYTVTAIWEPNNYTKFTRTRKVPADSKGDVVVVDMTKAYDTEKIKIRYVPTPDDVVAKMCQLAKVTKKDTVFDLGCGDGRIVIQAVEKFGAKRGVGIDLDPLRIKESKANARAQRVENKVTFRVGDVLDIKDLSDADVVMLYMGDDINIRLRPILQKTLKPGSRIVSHRFLMGDWKPARTEAFTGEDGDEYEVHLWVVGERKK